RADRHPDRRGDLQLPHPDHRLLAADREQGAHDHHRRRGVHPRHRQQQPAGRHRRDPVRPLGAAGHRRHAAVHVDGDLMPLPPGVTLAPSTGILSGTPTSDGTFPATFTVTDSLGASVSAPLVFTIVPASTTTGIPQTSSVDSLIIADQIELLGGSVPSTNPACAGAVFLLQPGYDLSAPQPTTDIIGSLILDGERPFGYRASDRQITLPIMIDCRLANDGQGGFAALTGAYEVLMQAIDEQEWTLTWTRANGQPLVFDCFRAQPTVVTWGGADQNNISPVGAVSLTFSALPYGRSDTPTEILVASPLPGHSLPAQPIVLDDFS